MGYTHRARNHYCYVIMGDIASQITSLTSVYSTVYSDADQRKHRTGEFPAHKWPVTRKMFPFDDVIMYSNLDQRDKGKKNSFITCCIVSRNQSAGYGTTPTLLQWTGCAYPRHDKWYSPCCRHQNRAKMYKVGILYYIATEHDDCMTWKRFLGESTCHQPFLLAKGHSSKAMVIFFTLVCTFYWTNSRVASEFRHHGALVT